MSDDHLDPHLQADHHAPDRTTPQGTQSVGLEHGHEGRDLIFRPIVLWFGGFAIFLGLSLILLHATMGLWTAREARETALPSPLFAEQQEIPAPRILPNPIDSGLNPMERFQRYPETVPGEREIEMQESARVGVLDPQTGSPILPDRAVATVLSRHGSGGGAVTGRTAPAAAADQAGTPAVKALRPSDSSGGTATEDWLR
jgi:hypothetical protein